MGRKKNVRRGGEGRKEENDDRAGKEELKGVMRNGRRRRRQKKGRGRGGSRRTER